MKRAVIDLGTNTFNLLIGEISNGELHRLRSEKEAVLLGMNGINHGKIAEEAWMRALKALIKFKSYCDDEGVTDIVGFGTSAIRDADNSELFLKEVKEQTGIPIKVVSGQQEAQLIYRGVRLLHDFTQEGMIMDIGGGSTEFVYANQKGVISKGSFDVGVSRLYQDLGKNNNLKDKDFKFISDYLDARMGDFFANKKSKVLIGASGSFETFYEMIFQKRFPGKDKTENLPLNLLLEKIDWVLDSRFEDRVNHEWIIPMRKKMLPIAAFKIKWVIEKLGIEKVIVCPYSLKEGAFLNL